ncbi:hypothetical protein Slin14017_G078700 [Septoria linicola]|nr:hypothetical protein Slin14017_G078700 [Septoria linicola]
MAGVNDNLTTSLPACPSICAPCYLGASTDFANFPWNVTKTVDVTIVPLVTGLANGQSSTYGYETTTDTSYEAIESGSGEQRIFGEDETLTWSSYGTILTYPTTYAYLRGFSGASAPSASDSACADLADLTTLELPATTNPAQFLYTPVSGTDASTELMKDVLPTALLSYLGSLGTVVEQLGGNTPSICYPTTEPFESELECTTLSSSSSYFATLTDADGSLSSSCTTATAIITTTLTPTSQSALPTSFKTPAAVLRRVDGPAKLAPYTPPPGAIVPTPSPAQPQNEGPSDPTPPTATQPVQQQPPPQSQPAPPSNDNSPKQEDFPTPNDVPDVPTDNTSGQGVPGQSEQLPVSETSTPEGDVLTPDDNQNTATPDSESSSDNPQDGTSPPEDEDIPEEGEEPPEGQEQAPEGQEQTSEIQETNGTAPPDGDGPGGASSTGEEDSIHDSTGSVPPLTTSLPGPDATEPSGSAATPDAGMTGAGDYIASGMGSSQSKALTSVSPSGTSVIIEPYTGSASEELGISYGMAFLGMMLFATLL